MKRLSLGLLLCSLVAASVPPAWAADDLAISQRADEALMWQRKSRDDLAADIWRRILVLDPNHPLALLNMGLIEARAGHPAEARALLLRAQRLKKPPIGLARLEAALADQPDVPPAPEYAEPSATVRVERTERAEASEGSEARASAGANSRTARKRRTDAQRADDEAQASASRRERSTRTESRRAVEPAAELEAKPTAVASNAPAPAREERSGSGVAARAGSASTAPSARSNGNPSSTARVAVPEAGPADDERSPAIPFPELASQLPMGTNLSRPPVAQLEATPSGTVVKGKPRPTKPLPFLPPPI